MQHLQEQTTAHVEDRNITQIIQRLQEIECRYQERDEQVRALENKNKLLVKEIEDLNRIVREIALEK